MSFINVYKGCCLKVEKGEKTLTEGKFKLNVNASQKLLELRCRYIIKADD